MGTGNQGSGLGEYRRRISIQKPLMVQDSTGSKVPERWIDVWRDVPCSINGAGSRELFAAQQIQADLTAVIKFRWRPDVDETMRCVRYIDKSRKRFEVYNIEGVPITDPTGRVEITLNCKQRGNEGFRTDKDIS